MRCAKVCFLAVGICIIVAGNAAAQRPNAYPSAGQSPEQQQRDEWECHQWAVQRTGVDPAALAAAPAYQPPPPTAYSRGGEVIGGAARGAALGAIGGAIGGNTKRGVKIGAAVGAVGGLMRKSRRHRREEQQRQQLQMQQQQAVQKLQQYLYDYDNAYAACMKGMNYSL